LTELLWLTIGTSDRMDAVMNIRAHKVREISGLAQEILAFQGLCSTELVGWLVGWLVGLLAGKGFDS